MIYATTGAARAGMRCRLLTPMLRPPIGVAPFARMRGSDVAAQVRYLTMLSLENQLVRVEVDPTTLRIIDRARGATWEAELAQDGMSAPAVRAAENAITIQYAPTGGSWDYRLSLETDHLLSTLRVRGESQRAPLCWRFRPHGSRAQALIPQYQGALLSGGTETWSAEAVRGGHTNLSMGMLGLTCERGGLLIVPDDLVGWVARYGNDERGPWAMYDAVPFDIEGWREMAVRVYPCDRGTAGVCLRYRRIVQERRQWVSWETKIAAKPSLQKLFGSLIAFIGYVHDDTTDYVAGIRRLREMGFASVLAYPARFAHYTDLTMADGRPPIHLTDAQIAAMKAQGALVAPWAWVFEGKDDGSQRLRSIFRQMRDGPARGWAMDGQQWYQVCPPYQAQHIRERLASDMNAMDWLHFDVNATYPARACWSKDHALHPGAPLLLNAAIEETRRLLSPATVGDRIVSSEGFNDSYTNTYDIGSTKMVPLDDAKPQAVPIPMTMLVYHDCCVHDWWEVHNYNANPSWNLGNTHTGQTALGRAGSGEPQLKAAIDALYGLPPNVFPFGMQYGWIDRPGGKTYPFRMSLGDAAVQEALRAALPVSQLHGRVGRLAMTNFEFIGGNLLVQRTTFADGTQISANLGKQPVGPFGGHAWQETKP